jgi:DNA-binding transcriptional ArsR family regulator
MHAGAMIQPIDPRHMLACIGDQSRYQVIQALAGGERCVTDVARHIGRSQSCTTRHLQALARGGIVAGERSGKRVLFRLRLDEPRVRELVEWALGQGPRAPEVTAAAPPVAAAGSRRRSPPRQAAPVPADSPAVTAESVSYEELEDFLL